MDAKQRQRSLLAVLAAGAVVAAWVNWPSSTLAPAPGGGRTPRRASASRGPSATGGDATGVQIDVLHADRPVPRDGDRNLFKFKPRYVPPPPAAARTAAPPVALPPPGPPPAPAAAPIPLKFIGVIESPGAVKMAVLSDGRGAPVYGKEGDAVLGQYRITRIGAESIEIEHVDGRGRQTIRLSGT